MELLRRAAAPGLKPLRLPRAHLPHSRVNKTKQHCSQDTFPVVPYQPEWGGTINLALRFLVVRET